MKILFVHGMGRSPLSGWRLLRYLRKKYRVETQTFSYLVSIESFEQIEQRLQKRISAIAEKDDYILIGHSLGGVLIRATINALADRVKPPTHTFLLGSPLQPSRLAKYFRRYRIFRLMTNDCGDLLASEIRMQAIAAISSPVTSLVGISGPQCKSGPFKNELNDGIVSLSEVSADWLTDQIQVKGMHSFLSSNKQVIRHISARMDG